MTLDTLIILLECLSDVSFDLSLSINGLIYLNKRILSIFVYQPVRFNFLKNRKIIYPIELNDVHKSCVA